MPIFYLDNHPSLILGKKIDFQIFQQKINVSNAKIKAFTNDFQPNDFEVISYSDFKSNLAKQLPSNQIPSPSSVIEYFKELSSQDQIQKSLFWVSDFPKNRQLPEFDFPVKIFPLSRTSQPNVVVDSVWIEDGFIQAKEKFFLRIRLKNSQISPTNKSFSIRFYLKDFQLGNQTFNFSKGSTCELKFAVSLPSAGEFPAYFVLDDDWDFDNKYHLILRTSKAQKVYFVSNKASKSDLNRVFQSDSLFDFEQISKEKWLSKKSTPSGFSIIYGVENFTTTEWNIVLQRLQDGQSLTIIPESKDDDIQAISFLRQLNNSFARMNSRNNASKLRLSIQPDFKIPFFSKIIESNTSNENFKTWNSSLTWIMPKTKNSILYTTNRISFLEKVKLGKGQLFVFSSDVLDPRNEFSKHGLFLPVFQELVLQSSNSENLSLEYNRNWFKIYPEKEFRSENLEKKIIKLKGASSEFIPEQEWEGDHWKCRLPPTIESGIVLNGFYRIFSGDDLVGLVAINFSKNESETEVFSLNDLKKHYKGNKNVQLITDFDAVNFHSSDIQNWTSSRILLLLALFFFFVELGFLLYDKLKV